MPSVRSNINLYTEILRHAIDTSYPAIERGGHSLRLEITPETILVEVDPMRLAQVFTNLLNNAAKYTEQGGVIFVKAERRDGEAVIAVRDTGVGIPAEMLPRIFDLFTQVDRTLGRAQGGLGIGLALVRNLLHLHGGSVHAYSEGLGRGTTFVVRLPLADDRAVEESMQESALRALTTTHRILVIDDDPDVADSLVMLLETFGATVRAAYSGAEGLEMLEEFEPDLVFLDLGMPRMDGYETARLIRSRPRGKDLILVALTGWGEEQVYARARAAGFDRQITKPADPDALQILMMSVDGGKD